MSTATAATSGVKGAMAGMATAFAATIVVEVVFWLLDKLTGGKLSGSAKKLNAEPADMKQSAGDMQAAAKEMKQQTGTLDALTQKLGGLWQGATQLKALKDLAEFNKGVAKAADQKVKLGHAVTEIAESLTKGQQSFVETVKKYGGAAMAALSSLFGGFMAMVIAGLAFKLIMVLVSKVVGEIGSKGAQIRTTNGAAVSAIAGEVQARAQAAKASAAAPSTSAKAPSMSGSTPARLPTTGAVPGAAPATTAPGAVPVSTAAGGTSSGSGWTPVPQTQNAPAPTGSMKVTVSKEGDITMEVPEDGVREDYRVTVAASLADGRKATATFDVDADPVRRPDASA